jgi:hypothetical protein
MAKKKFRIREIKMSYGEIRFIPEKLEEHNWILVGDQEHYLSMEQAKQQIDQYKMSHQNENHTEVIHEID